MKPIWHELGYPGRHYDEVRRANRHACAVISAAGVQAFAPPGGTAGVYQTRRSVRITPYFQRRMAGIENFPTDCYETAAENSEVLPDESVAVAVM